MEPVRVAEPLRPESLKNLVPSEPWPEADLFGPAELPAFPVDALSPWLRDWALAESVACQVPVDLPSVLSLACCSLGVSRGVSIQVSPAWREPPNLWAVVGAKPGERKSPVFDAATKPIFAYQAQAEKDLAPKVAEYDSTKRIIAAKIAGAEKAAAADKLYQGGDARQAVRRLNEELLALAEVAPPCLLADDTTPEAVVSVLQSAGERLGIFSSEGGIFEIMAGRYSEGANLEIWLKSHSGDSHTVHRVKRAAVYLKNPLVTMALTTQPTVIQGLAMKEGFRGKGLLARFLYALPLSPMGGRDCDPLPIPEHVHRAYGSGLISILSNLGKPRRLTMSAGATAARLAFQRALEPRLGPDGDLEPIADWAGKLTGLVARVAGILHVTDHAHVLHLPPGDGGEAFGGMPEEIQTDTWRRAELVGDYALAHARAAFGAMASKPAEALAERIWRWVERKRLDSFSARDAYKAAHVASEEADPALTELVQRGLIRQRCVVAPSVGRPAGPSYDVNTAVSTLLSRHGRRSENGVAREREEANVT